ncbi:MAG TPA: DUF1579 domain-containing protein [Chitinophagaceae bacterium]
MKRITLAFCALTLLLNACNNAAKNETASDTSTVSKTTSYADTSTTHKDWVPMDTSKMMQAMMEYGAVGEPQKMLAKSTGNWNGQVVWWMGQNAPADTSMTTVSNKMIMGDRFLVSSYKGNMMGMPFEGTSTTGYDNAKKVYISTWIDNMSSGIMTMEGPYDAASKSIVMTGEMVSPVDGRTCKLKQVMRMVDDKTHIMEMYGPDPMTGVQYKNMQITLTKK